MEKKRLESAIESAVIVDDSDHRLPASLETMRVRFQKQTDENILNVILIRTVAIAGQSVLCIPMMV